MISLLRMQASNSLRLTHFFDPTYNTKGQWGCLSMASTATSNLGGIAAQIEGFCLAENKSG